MFVIKYKKLFVGISLLFVALSLVFLAVYGLKFGIDFTGGSALQLTYTDSRPEVQELQSILTNAGFGDAHIANAGAHDIVIKSSTLTERERATIISLLSVQNTYTLEQKSFTTIGPSIGSELKRKSIASIIVVLIAIILFVAYAFRKVSRPVSSWKYGLVVIIALVHDIIIPTGIFALLGHFYGFEVDTLFIVALLTTLGLSISDTIVVFDRIRENLGESSGKSSAQRTHQSFDQLVGDSLSQTFARSINTSLLVLIMVLSLVFFGPSSTRLFSIVLAIGMFFGTYSSIFLASPLLVMIQQSQKTSTEKNPSPRQTA